MQEPQKSESTLIYMNAIQQVPVDLCRWVVQEFACQVLISAPELQRHPQADEVLATFGKRLSLISIDVDDELTVLQSLQKALSERSEYKVVWLNHFDKEELSVLASQLQYGELPKHSVVVSLPGLLSVQETRGLGRLMSLDGEDYRRFLGRSQVFAKDLFLSLDFKELKSEQTWLQAWIRQGVHFLPLALNQVSSYTFPKGLSWRHWYWDVYFMTLSIFKGTTRPLRSSLAMAIGVFLASSPLYGLQTLILAAACWLFRLNFPVAFLGAQISLPPTYTLVVAAELVVGAHLTGKTFSLNGSWIEIAEQHSLSWFVGFVVVGGALALLSAILWYQVLKWSRRTT